LTSSLPEIEIDFKKTYLLLNQFDIIRERGATTAKQTRNIKEFGVKYPSAITEAIATVKTTTIHHNPKLSKVTMKIDTGASVSLAHSQFLSEIKDSRSYNLPPVRLNGIGGRTEVLTKCGFLKVRKSEKSSEMIDIKCYAFDIAIGRTAQLCLISSWAIDHFSIDQQYHLHTSLRHGPQNLRFNKRKYKLNLGPEKRPSKSLHLQKNKEAESLPEVT
jgi:hypothetical protein